MFLRSRRNQFSEHIHCFWWNFKWRNWFYFEKIPTFCRELKELQQQLADKEAEFVKSRAADDEEASHEKEEALRLAQRRWDEEREVLKQQLQDAALSISRTEQAGFRREALLKEEMKHLQMVNI